MTETAFERRIARLEAEKSAAAVELGVLFLPHGLSKADQDAWLAERTTKGGSGRGVIVIPRKGSR